MAEASLMSLLEAMLALAARPALVSRPTVNVKAGGYPEELFIGMSEEEKEDLECAICYQVLKEVMECRNKHRFCYTCIQVWSTTGEYLNRIRCPVCRCEGHYSRNPDLDEKIELKRVKCSLEGCTWKGLLKYSGTHKHSNYQTQTSSSSNTPNLPQLKTRQPSDSTSSRSQPRLISSRSRFTPASSDRNNNVVDAEAVALSEEINNNAFMDSEPTSPIAPIPPQTPRPTNLVRRRVPTLPSIVHNSNSGSIPPSVAPASTQAASGSGAGLLSRRRISQSQAPLTLTARTSTTGGNLSTVRDRLVESRNRLEGLVSSFGDDEDEQRSPEVETFHEERELNRQQQMQEVHELGRRLGQVARELRELLDHRRNLQDSISSSDSDD